ncbi:MAG: hypothetical protein FWD58_10975 [Firmicutes bacterium]|nr:hypothetical protein [Bacillota bacterium]
MITPKKTPLVMGLGFFDCVHAGHRALIAEVISLAEKLGCAPCLSTFFEGCHGDVVVDRLQLEPGGQQLRPRDKFILTYAERITIFERLCVMHVLPFVFDAEFKATGKGEFLEMLFCAYDIRGVVCGHDYRFGRNGEGDAEYLTRFASGRGVEIKVIEPVVLDGARVSSTLIKELIARGEIEKTNRLLSDPFFMRGEVVKGKGRGSLHGFPTANLEVPSEKLLPSDGVYATKTTVDGKVFRSVTHIGPKPTFLDATKTVETLVENFSGDLYGKYIKVEFLKRIRGTERFDSPGALLQQIKKDLDLANKE